MSEPEWEYDGWWRATAPDGSIWCETSNEQEVREAMRPGDTLWYHEQRVDQRWVKAEE
jgi:hypothetical protein